MRAHEFAGARAGQDGLNRDYRDERLAELLGEEPAVIETHPPPSVPIKQETEGDRAAKRRAREERG